MPQSRDDRAELKRLSAEHASLREALARITLAWSHIENTFSLVLRNVLDDGPGFYASAIYFAPAGAEVRIKIVDAAFDTLAGTSPHYERTMHAWRHAVARINKLKETRNAAAHGMITTTNIGRGKSHVRLTAPIFDFRRIGLAASKGQLPGMSSNDILQSAKQMGVMSEILNRFLMVASALRAADEPTLLGTLAQLESDLRITFPPPDAPMKPEHRNRPLSFRAKRKIQRRKLWKKPPGAA